MDNKEVKYLIHVLDTRHTGPLFTFQFDLLSYECNDNLDNFLAYKGPMQPVVYIQELLFDDPSRIPNISPDKFHDKITWMVDFTGGVDQSRYYQLLNLLERFKVKFSNLHILVNSRYDLEFASEILNNKDVTITEIYYGNLIALREIISHTKGKRFISLIRNFNPYRFFNFIDLYRRGILENSYFSFFNIKDVYGDKKEHYSLEELDRIFFEVASQLSDIQLKEQLTDFWSSNRKSITEKMPYTLEGEVREVGEVGKQIVSRTLDRCFQDSYLSLLTETHMFYDNAVNNSYFSMTEKTAKVVYYRQPFVVYSDANFLKRFRQSGYQTFSPLVDETYDMLTNPVDRILSINDQIEKLNNLEIKQFKKIMFDLQVQTTHNYKQLIDHFTNLPSKVASNKPNSIISDIVLRDTHYQMF
jgi:hypothetical protein